MTQSHLHGASARIRSAIALMATPGLGRRGQLRLLRSFGDAPAACQASAAQWRSAGVAAPRNALPSLEARCVEGAVATLTRCATELICWGEPAYPARLCEIPDPPPFLFVRGDISPCRQPTLAIVGARRASAYGRRMAEQLAATLAAAGFVIVSGLALGVDAAAHGGALQAGGRTVAVTACGPERIYPRSHGALAHAIARQGAVVTEFGPGAAPLAAHFPQRNRIISGLSLGVVVVEAGARSGSLITARMALEQGREVFAVPGAVTNPLAHGTHQLLRDGARLVADANDVIEELAPQLPAQSPTPMGRAATDLSDVAARLLGELEACPTSADQLAAQLPHGIREVTAALQELALQGLVEKQRDGHWSAC